ncbi:formate dehydrogenase accessory sulfurtransferase FdhD [Gordonia sp. ABSL1-1]|uniref:formate dehydrogenase accessory sulfurtransferase FdhD n=1 Tax=Gordonia sp. ABSL1-1 TaxID=3053923 RepID=UPI002573D2CD|nr:formate dehydrogenase accessory sulfurtransferase FdhD [Gordonia sp. ABSL1-1]MDL9936693.1 formate dehydrogenase accessory sulfurtransferase FdhD [Gordonia sp. ABSL1-1]
MGRITTRRRVVRIQRGADRHRRADVLAVEEPLEIRVGGQRLAVTMRTPGNDFELVAGFLVAEGIISARDQLLASRYCAGATTTSDTLIAGANTYNVVDTTLAAGVPAPEPRRNYTMTSACGVCGKASIDDVVVASDFDIADDSVQIDSATLLRLPDALRTGQAVFDKTGGLHAAALFDADGDMLVLREDVGRHNAVDKVIGWALLNGRLPLRGHILQVSGRASFELVQKATMAGVPLLSAVSAPSSLAVELAEDRGMTLAGFVRGDSMVVYTRDDRIADDDPA